MIGANTLCWFWRFLAQTVVRLSDAACSVAFFLLSFLLQLVLPCIFVCGAVFT